MLTFDERLSFINKVDREFYGKKYNGEDLKPGKESELPIVLHEREIMENIENFVVTVVCGETGSGKSTQIP